MKNIDRTTLRVEPGRSLRLTAYDPGSTGDFDAKHNAEKKLAADIEELAALQSVFAASATYALLIVLQGMDAAGKDGAIKHVMTGVNPQGVDVHSFKVPSATELAHDYLWRSTIVLPPRGRIGIFNRSYYEELLVTRVHPAVLAGEDLPPQRVSGPDLWRDRYDDINAFERHMTRNGTLIVKFFLHLSSEEQRKRLLERIETPDKNWKLSAADVRERTFWDAYQRAYEEMLAHTSSAWAPWYVIPADHKWFTRLAIANIVVATLADLNLAYPEVDGARRAQLADLGKQLAREGA